MPPYATNVRVVTPIDVVWLSAPRYAVDRSSVAARNSIGHDWLAGARNHDWHKGVSLLALALVDRLARIGVDAVDLCLVVGGNRLCVNVFYGGLASLSVFGMALVVLHVLVHGIGSNGGSR